MIQIQNYGMYGMICDIGVKKHIITLINTMVGRGIKVYKEWEDYSNFKRWAIKSGYKEGLTIDRIDFNGNYEPNNCRWITQAEQVKNTRRNLPIDLKELSKETGIRYGTLLYRYHHHLNLKTGGNI